MRVAERPILPDFVLREGRGLDTARPTTNHYASFSTLLKLFPKLRELLSQFRDLILQRRDFAFQPRDPPTVRRVPTGNLAWRLACEHRVVPCGVLDIPAHQMDVARLLGSRLPRQNLHQRRLPLHQFLQSRLHIAQFLKTMQPLPAAAYFAGSLRSAQQQDAQDRRLRPREIKNLAQTMFILPHATIIGIRSSS